MRLLCVLFALALTTFAQTSSPPPASLMPVPATLQFGTGQLLIDQSFSAALIGTHDDQMQHAALNFFAVLSRKTGIPLNNKLTDPAKAHLVIRTERPAKAVQELGEDESYNLEVKTSGAQLTAPTALGAMRGLQTFLQLVRPSGDGFAVPAVTIQDKPRFPWRGLMIDVGRHFIPLDVLKRNLDGMAAMKMNVFHWHLSENQGFRVESKRFPKLHEMGSDGLYYSQDEVRSLITYAHDRGIRVVPEFDIPGHSTAWFVGYPELASAPGPYEIERKWGVFDPAMDPTQERTYKFLDEFIGEMAKLFPDRFFHIGGDEVNGKQWDANLKIQEFKRTHGLKTNQDLQAYFNKRVQEIVTKHKKIMIGWDEILDPDLPKDIVIQSWRGQQSLAAAAIQGYRGLLSYGYYVDLMWPAWRHYAVDPMADVAAALSPEESQRILGGEACMWSEYVSPENIDSRIWPRTAAIAERLWSPQDVQDINSMYQRLATISGELDWLGLTHNSNYEPMLRRIAAAPDVSPLRALADVVEPVKDYTREETAPAVPTSATPLNRLVDAARPESDTARNFTNLVDSFVSGQSTTPETKAHIRSSLIRWRDSQAHLQPLLNSSFLLKEVAPLSQDLGAISAVASTAMDYIDRGQRAPEAWTAQQRALLEQAAKQKTQLLLMVVLPVQKLVEASAAPRPPPSK
jgi:hexosaminidase